jgi:hypothetical protein
VSPRARDALLWGAVSAAAFLALAQGYRLVAGLPLDTLGVLGVGGLVGCAGALVSYLAAPRLAHLGGNGQR